VRVGWGVDAHRFTADGQVLLAGIVADLTRGIDATSDGDVAAHAVIDALLGAAAMGDIGSHYPSDDPRWTDADSMEMLADAVRLVVGGGYSIVSVDLTVVAQTIRIGPIREAMRAAIAATLQITLDAVSVKATTSDGLGFTGRDEGLAVFAVAVLDGESEDAQG
jgi:2-C-methyl-D-erythritol 2,4-cyclodiphosphate synthase